MLFLLIATPNPNLRLLFYGVMTVMTSPSSFYRWKSTPKCGSCRGGAFDGTYYYFWDYNGYVNIALHMQQRRKQPHNTQFWFLSFLLLAKCASAAHHASPALMASSCCTTKCRPNYVRQYRKDESWTGLQWQSFPSGDGLGMTFSKEHCALFLNDRARIWKMKGTGCPVITTTTVSTTTTTSVTTITTTTTPTTPTKEGNNDISARLDEVAADVTNLNAALDTKASADSMVTKLDEQSAAFDAQIKALTEAFDLKLQAQDKALTESFELKLQAQEQTMNRLKAELQEQQDTTPCAKFGIEANSDGVAVCTMQVDAIKSLRDNWK